MGDETGDKSYNWRVNMLYGARADIALDSWTERSAICVSQLITPKKKHWLRGFCIQSNFTHSVRSPIHEMSHFQKYKLRDTPHDIVFVTGKEASTVAALKFRTWFNCMSHVKHTVFEHSTHTWKVKSKRYMTLFQPVVCSSRSSSALVFRPHRKHLLKRTWK